MSTTAYSLAGSSGTRGRITRCWSGVVVGEADVDVAEAWIEEQLAWPCGSRRVAHGVISIEAAAADVERCSSPAALSRAGMSTTRMVSELAVARSMGASNM
ncbi:MAG: hypothetical protein U0610_04365 [bacterium]